MNKKNHTKKGFTLIELLVVISIIGVLSSIVLVGVNKSREKASASRALVQAKQLITATELASSNQAPVQDPSDYLLSDVSEISSYISEIPTVSTTISKIQDYYYISNGGSSGDGNGIEYHCINGFDELSGISDPPRSKAIVAWIDDTYKNSDNEKRSILALSADSITTFDFLQPGTFYYELDEDLGNTYGTDASVVRTPWGSQSPTAVYWWDTGYSELHPVACTAL